MAAMARKSFGSSPGMSFPSPTRLSLPVRRAQGAGPGGTRRQGGRQVQALGIHMGHVRGLDALEGVEALSLIHISFKKETAPGTKS